MCGLAGALMYFGTDTGGTHDPIGRSPDPIMVEELAAAPAQARPARPATAPTPQTRSTASRLPPVEGRSSLTVMEPLPGTAPIQAVVEIAPDPVPEPRMYVTGSRVNMRAGPTTGAGVVAALTRGTEVIDLGEAAPGWSQIRVADSGQRGFMATRFLGTDTP